MFTSSKFNKSNALGKSTPLKRSSNKFKQCFRLKLCNAARRSLAARLQSRGMNVRPKRMNDQFGTSTRTGSGQTAECRGCPSESVEIGRCRCGDERLPMGCGEVHRS